MKKIESGTHFDLEESLWILFKKNMVEDDMKQGLIRALDNIISNANKIKGVINDMHVNPRTVEFDTWRMSILRKKMGVLYYDCVNLLRDFEFGTLGVEEKLKDDSEEDHEQYLSIWNALLKRHYELMAKPREKWTPKDEKDYITTEEYVNNYPSLRSELTESLMEYLKGAGSDNAPHGTNL